MSSRGRLCLLNLTAEGSSSGASGSAGTEKTTVKESGLGESKNSSGEFRRTGRGKLLDDLASSCSFLSISQGRANLFKSLCKESSESQGSELKTSLGRGRLFQQIDEEEKKPKLPEPEIKPEEPKPLLEQKFFQHQTNNTQGKFEGSSSGASGSAGTEKTTVKESGLGESKNSSGEFRRTGRGKLLDDLASSCSFLSISQGRANLFKSLCKESSESQGSELKTSLGRGRLFQQIDEEEKKPKLPEPEIKPEEPKPLLEQKFFQPQTNNTQGKFEGSSSGASGSAGTEKTTVKESGLGESKNSSGEFRRTGRGKLLDDLASSCSFLSISQGRANLFKSLCKESSESQGSELKTSLGRGRLFQQIDEEEKKPKLPEPEIKPEEPKPLLEQKFFQPQTNNTQGKFGTSVKLVCNYIQLECDKNMGVFVYEVRFFPAVDSYDLRIKYLNEHRALWS